MMGQKSTTLARRRLSTTSSRPRTRRLRLLALLTAFGLLTFAAAWAATGYLNQKAGTAGCISEDGTGGACTDGTALDGAYSVTVSPDGKNAYAASIISGGVDHLHGGDRDDTLHGGTGGGKEKVNGNLNNILYGAAGTDLCSNGPLGGPNPKPNDPYAGTDRGDIRDPSCELPARGQSERVVRQGSSYVFVPFNIVVAMEFDWDSF